MKETKTVIFALFDDYFYHAFEGPSEYFCRTAIAAAEKEHGKVIFNKTEIVPFVIWATYADGASLCFAGTTEKMCFQAITDACNEHGRYVWYETVNVFETPTFLRPNARDEMLNKLHESEIEQYIHKMKGGKK